MLNLKPLVIKKIASIFFILVMVISGFIFIFNSNNDSPSIADTIAAQDNNDLNSNLDLSINENEQDESILAHPYSAPEQNIDGELNFYNPELDVPSREESSKSRAKLNYDLTIIGISISYPGLIWWEVNLSGIKYPFVIAGEIGFETNFSITIKNIGTNTVSNADYAMVTINLTDYFGRSSWEQQEYVGHILSDNKLIVNFTWIPTYSNRFNLTCSVLYSKDEDISNNIFKLNYLHTNKWHDNLEDGKIDDWAGDIGPEKWHLTDTIENDPNPDFHTNKSVLYHGKEDGSEDDYGERNDFELITPVIDLRRFDPLLPAFLNFKFYGSSTEERDKFTIEGYKSSDDKWYPIEIKFYGGETVNDTNNPTWYIWKSGWYLGIPIDAYAGELARFKIHWHSDLTPEQESGFYFDDFIIYGYELPPLEYDVSIEEIDIYPDNRPIVAGDEFQIKANISNNGIKTASGFKIDIQVKDFTGRIEEAKPYGANEITTLKPNEAKWYSWSIRPKVAGIYFINISLELALDEMTKNNYITDESVDVYIYYNSFESTDWTWVAEDGWSLVNVTAWSSAWYAGNSSTNLLDANMNSNLLSPVIDLDGAQENQLFSADQIRIGFKWFGSASSADRLYFEYALDHSKNWKLFTTPEKSPSIISGDSSDYWHSWDSLGLPELFGHHVQFRWRMETDSESNLNEIGYYIDDFKIWVIQEQYGRPYISDCSVSPAAIINDSRDSALISCEVHEGLSEIISVQIDLEPLGGILTQVMFDDGTAGDKEAGDGVYTISITATPTTEIGEKILKISALDKKGNFDNNYVKIIVKENLAPVIETHLPVNSSINIFEDERIEFSVQASDPEGESLTYNWFLNSVLIEYQTLNYFEFISSFHGEFSAGQYTLGVLVSDNGIPPKTIYLEWNIEILDVLPDFQINENDVEISSSDVMVDELVRIDIRVHNLQPPPENNITIHFIQQSTIATIQDKVFSVQSITLLPGFGSTSITEFWQANKSYKYLKISIDPTNEFFELNEKNNEVVIPVNVSEPISIEDPIIETPGTDDHSTSPYTGYIVIAVIIASLASIFGAIGTEFGRYQLFLSFAPFYYRVTGDKVLEHELRSKIYLHIRAHPGDHYRSIMAHLKLKNGTLVHHLARLEQEELICSERDGYYKRFYPVGMRIPKSEVGMYYPEEIPTYNIGEHQVSDIQLKIIKTIRIHPGITQKEISQRIDESRRVVNYHVKLLIQHDLIKVIKSGRKTECFVAEKLVGG
jgi:predicted transcriptional regulator